MLWIIVGDGLSARAWARERCIGLNSVITVQRQADLVRTQGLYGQPLSLVVLRMPHDPQRRIADRLVLLQAGGARRVPVSWRPEGNPPDIRVDYTDDSGSTTGGGGGGGSGGGGPPDLVFLRPRPPDVA